MKKGSRVLLDLQSKCDRHIVLCFDSKALCEQIHLCKTVCVNYLEIFKVLNVALALMLAICKHPYGEIAILGPACFMFLTLIEVAHSNSLDSVFHKIFCHHYPNPTAAGLFLIPTGAISSREREHSRYFNGIILIISG